MGYTQMMGSRPDGGPSLDQGRWHRMIVVNPQDDLWTTDDDTEVLFTAAHGIFMDKILDSPYKAKTMDDVRAEAELCRRYGHEDFAEALEEYIKQCTVAIGDALEELT